MAAGRWEPHLFAAFRDGGRWWRLCNMTPGGPRSVVGDRKAGRLACPSGAVATNTSDASLVLRRRVEAVLGRRSY